MNLKMPFKILAAMLISIPALSQADTRIPLNKGLTSLDLNNDGSPDAVFSATYDNNTSHPGDTFNIFIRQGKDWFIVPVPDDDGFTWENFRLSASSLKISGTELHRYKGRVYLIRATKYAGSSGNGDVTDKSRVRFSRFQLEKNIEDPGTSIFYWHPEGIYLTKQYFDDVDEAFQILDMEKFR
ncbi:CpmJ protein [Erwinia sp. S43]|uniref:carbapenem self-resistance protein CarG family protein n=1 Tax=unclassified Erwinia TaxID=2622719 RepID=UPI001909B111|nr:MULTISPECIES: CpmJ protein [unclassified Erwinia]MBK0004772.1 CpmJ protein [Erwinia sp. S38]MBK0035483.1 CpmJ protein [Erwinia sp. S43]